MLKKFKIWITKIFACKIMRSHDWTNAASKGIKPTKTQLSSMEGFLEYARVYCERCGCESSRNLDPNRFNGKINFSKQESSSNNSFEYIN